MWCLLCSHFVVAAAVDSFLHCILRNTCYTFHKSTLVLNFPWLKTHFRHNFFKFKQVNKILSFNFTSEVQSLWRILNYSDPIIYLSKCLSSYNWLEWISPISVSLCSCRNNACSSQLPVQFEFWWDFLRLVTFTHFSKNTYWILIWKIYFLECRGNCDNLAYRKVNSVTVKQLQNSKCKAITFI